MDFVFIGFLKSILSSQISFTVQSEKHYRICFQVEWTHVSHTICTLETSEFNWNWSEHNVHSKHCAVLLCQPSTRFHSSPSISFEFYTVVVHWLRYEWVPSFYCVVYVVALVSPILLILFEYYLFLFQIIMVFYGDKLGREFVARKVSTSKIKRLLLWQFASSVPQFDNYGEFVAGKPDWI